MYFFLIFCLFFLCTTPCPVRLLWCLMACSRCCPSNECNFSSSVVPHPLHVWHFMNSLSCLPSSSQQYHERLQNTACIFFPEGILQNASFFKWICSRRVFNAAKPSIIPSHHQISTPLDLLALYPTKVCLWFPRLYKSTLPPPPIRKISSFHLNPAS